MSNVHIYKLSQSILLFIATGCFISSSVFATQTDLEKKWAGRWDNVGQINTRLPEEALFRTVNVYDIFEISNVTKTGFEYRNVGNDVGYGPNEQTYSEGTANFTAEGIAEDNKSGLLIYYYQGEKKWDRGLSVQLKNNTDKKYFKKVRTQFEAGFNCDNAGTSIEKRICSVAILARADKELSLLYNNLRKSLTKSEASKLRRSQRTWMKKRDENCQDKHIEDDICLSSLYASRLVFLRRMSDPAIGQKTQLLDADFIKSVNARSHNLMDDTVLRLVFKSHGQDGFVQQWMTYKPEVKAVFSGGEAIVTGQYQYNTIIWPADVVVRVNFQLVVNDKAQIWFSKSIDNGSTVEVQTYFGTNKHPNSVMGWMTENKKIQSPPIR